MKSVILENANCEEKRVKIIILNESKAPDPLNNVEKRCAATPSSALRMIKKGATLLLEAGAGQSSGYSDKQYEEVGVAVIDDVNDSLSSADMVVAVNKPTDAQLALMKKGAIVVGHLDPFFQQPLVESIAQKELTAISVEMIPRSSRAQKMDALSSQASLAGYVMVMQAANLLPSILPMMMTPSGTIKPAKVFIIGAGVAGLQAIATAKRLGANVLAYDTRPVVAEQVESLGGKFLKIDIGETGQTKDGYAKELTDEQKAKQQDAQRDAIADVHWAEQSMVQAHNRITQLETGYRPQMFDCEHPYFKTPNRTDCYAQLGPSVKRDWCNKWTNPYQVCAWRSPPRPRR